MNRDGRKVSRSLEDRSVTASTTTRASQISHADNELKQKLESIDQSYKLSNKRIDNETRELKKILYGLQQELRVSKSDTRYIPSMLEQPQERTRRRTIGSLPFEDKNRSVTDRGNDLQGFSNDYKTNRRRSGSHPPATLELEVKKLKESYQEGAEDDILTHEKGKQIVPFADKSERVERQQRNSLSQHLADTQNYETAKGVQRLSDVNNNREIWGTNSKQKLLAKRFPREQIITSGNRKSTTEGGLPFVSAFKGRFITNQKTPNETPASPNSPNIQKNAVRDLLGDGVDASRQSRWSVVGENPPTPYQPSQRKTSYRGSPNVAQRKLSNCSASNSTSPQPRLTGHYNTPSTEVALDSLSEQLGGRGMSLAHGRIRKHSRILGLPSVTEERLTPKQELEVPSETWNDLAKCRYLRKDEKEISIDDIFSKK